MGLWAPRVSWGLVPPPSTQRTRRGQLRRMAGAGGQCLWMQRTFQAAVGRFLQGCAWGDQRARKPGLGRCPAPLFPAHTSRGHFLRPTLGRRLAHAPDLQSPPRRQLGGRQRGRETPFRKGCGLASRAVGNLRNHWRGHRGRGTQAATGREGGVAGPSRQDLATHMQACLPLCWSTWAAFCSRSEPGKPHRAASASFPFTSQQQCPGTGVTPICKATPASSLSAPPPRPSLSEMLSFDSSVRGSVICPWTREDARVTVLAAAISSACGIPTGIEPSPLALGAWSLNHRTAREVSVSFF